MSIRFGLRTGCDTRPPLLVCRGPPPSRSSLRATGHSEAETTEPMTPSSSVTMTSVVPASYGLPQPRRAALEQCAALKHLIVPSINTGDPCSTPSPASPPPWCSPLWSNHLSEPLSSLLPQMSFSSHRLDLEHLRASPPQRLVRDYQEPAVAPWVDRFPSPASLRGWNPSLSWAGVIWAQGK
jgi:hypothetical protein